jgi:hypothetical protein
MKLLFTMILVAGIAGTSLGQQVKKKPFDQYGKLLGKSISYVMRVGEIKDTVGKTSLVRFQQGQKEVVYLQFRAPTGEMLGFEKNKLSWVGPR